ncbi:SsrA-binding protein SmpB [Candidatus Saccharibacteria bacterium]|nr:SsrA-binding protein SmpB [Candidatus Saccharibacteria bacterium]
MKKKGRPAGRIANRRARFDYELGAPLVVGLQLTGAETKALRWGQGQLQGAYVNIKDEELWLIGALISPGRGLDISESDQTRSRKLLAKRSEIAKLAAAKQQGMTIVPLEILTTGHFIKLRIAPGKGRRKYDKRETIKRRQQEREIARQARG